MSERPTPETDAAELAAMDDTGCITSMSQIWDTMMRLERERDEALEKLEDIRKALRCTGHEGPILAALRVVEERDEARERVAKLRELAKRAIDDLGWFHAEGSDRLRVQLDQIKEGAK